jgi:hypothetical protein
LRETRRGMIYHKEAYRGILPLGNQLTGSGHGPTLARVFSRVSQVSESL